MKVIILAAGIGSRLGQNLPKSLVRLTDDLTILDLQIKHLIKLVDLKDIIVVTGFKNELIFQKYPYLNFVYNPNYLKTNTSKSLLIGLKDVPNEDVLWINGDVVFEESLIDLIKENHLNNLISVNKDENIGLEEVKYTIDSEGFINNISKSVKNGQGESIGINLIKKENIATFRSCLKECDDNDYFEKAIEMGIEKGIRFSALDIGNRFAVEVDFKEDLEKAKEFIKEVF